MLHNDFLYLMILASQVQVADDDVPGPSGTGCGKPLLYDSDSDHESPPANPERLKIKKVKRGVEESTRLDPARPGPRPYVDVRRDTVISWIQVFMVRPCPPPPQSS